MKNLLFIASMLCIIVTSNAQQLKSPDGDFNLNFSLLQDGTPSYSLLFKGKTVVKPSKLGLELKEGEGSLLNNFTVTDTKVSAFDETWVPVWGEVNSIRNHYNELAVTLKQKVTDRVMVIRFRLFDDGLGFRYEFPVQKKPYLFYHKGREDTVCHDR